MIHSERRLAIMGVAMRAAELMSLPGFRFSPLEHELVGFYLKMMVEGKDVGAQFIGTVDLYKHHPRELPALAVMGEREWYFFVPRDRKYPNGSRPNRVTTSGIPGYWKATGTDRPVASTADYIGLRKTLVFYEGKAPKGVKTPWIMNEYRLRYVEAESSRVKNDVTLCKIYLKGTTRGCGSYHREDVGGTMPPPSPPNDLQSASGASVSDNVARGDVDSPAFDSETSPPQPHAAESPPIGSGICSASSPESDSMTTGNSFPRELPGLADSHHWRDAFQPADENVMFSGFEDIRMPDRQLEEQLQAQQQLHCSSASAGIRNSSWFQLERLGLEDWSELNTYR